MEPKKPFEPSPHLSDEINRNIEASEHVGGCDLRKLEVGNAITVVTMNTEYLVKRVAPGPGGFEISGHPKFCPTPTPCSINGSTWGGSMLKMEFVGLGMHMEFVTDPTGREVITTSMVQKVVEVAA